MAAEPRTPEPSTSEPAPEQWTSEQWQAPAEIYTGRTRRGWAQSSPLRYRRFSSLAEAIRYQVEQQVGAAVEATIHSGDLVVTGSLIQALYESDGYPFPRAGTTPS